VWAPQPAELEQLLAWRHVVRRVTLAPELPGCLEATRTLAAAGVLVSAGHTKAVYEDVMAAVDAGLSHVTHLWNQSSLVTRRGPYRHGGVVETALLEDALTGGLIADGHHLPPELLRLAFKCKGADKACVVTDAMRGASMPEGTAWPVGPQGSPIIGVVRSGVSVSPDNSAFASSIATMDQLLRNAVRLAGLSLPDAARAASLTPARILGLAGRKGSLTPGKDADFVVLDGNLQVRETVVLGHSVYRRV
jgi:N-acetylglucosamine-6-phosphate deacetylase